MINRVVSETKITTNDFTVESKIEEHTVFFFWTKWIVFLYNNGSKVNQTTFSSYKDAYNFDRTELDKLYNSAKRMSLWVSSGKLHRLDKPATFKTEADILQVEINTEYRENLNA